jgi:hypothetical protein
MMEALPQIEEWRQTQFSVGVFQARFLGLVLGHLERGLELAQDGIGMVQLETLREGQQEENHRLKQEIARLKAHIVELESALNANTSDPAPDVEMSPAAWEAINEHMYDWLGWMIRRQQRQKKRTSKPNRQS